MEHLRDPGLPLHFISFPTLFGDHHLTGKIQEHTTSVLHSFSETPVMEGQIRESLPAGTTWLPKNLTVRSQLHEGPAPLAAFIRERPTHVLVPITSA